MIIKKLFFIVAVTTMMCACSKANRMEDNSLDTASVVSQVRDIYAAVFKVYNEEDSLSNLGLPIKTSAWERRNEFNTLYFSTELNEVLNKVEEINSLLNGRWEHDYWIKGEDWHNLSISDIKVVSIDRDKAVVEFQLHNSDSTQPVQPVRVIMVKENGIWKIDTFIDEEHYFKDEVGYDWKKDLQEYVKNNYPQVIEIHSILNAFREAMRKDWHNLSISDEQVVGMDYDYSKADEEVPVVDMSEPKEVKAMDYDCVKAAVEFQLHNSDSTQPVRAFMVKENGIWIIETFHDQEGKDCKKEMQEYVKQNNHRAKNN